jgi:dipeptidyl-peptidase-4
MSIASAGDLTPAESYPRQKARTRSFQLGRPRSFACSPTSPRALFIRSASGSDDQGCLWLLDLNAPIPETLLVDAANLAGSDLDLPDAERARRERMREVAAGITSFSTDRSMSRALFTVSGVPYLVDIPDVPSAPTAPIELPAPGPVVDPRLSPDGTHAAFVVNGSFYACNLDTMAITELAAPAGAHDFWGLADFVSAEELERHRGYWWLEGSRSLLVQHTDEADVEIRWISDPANPQNEPVQHRYPAAGTANPQVRLAILGIDGSRIDVEWDHETFPYLSSVHATDAGVVLAMLTRDQRTQSISTLDITTGALTEIARRVGPCWIDVVHGVPALLTDGRLVEVLPDSATDTYRVCIDGAPISPAGLQVSAVMEIADNHLIVLAQPTAITQAGYRLGLDGSCEAITDVDEWCALSASEAIRVVMRASGTDTRTAYTATAGTLTHSIANLAETPCIDVRPHFVKAGARQLNCAVLLPAGHVLGSARLPVIMSPYGGPHAQRVIRAGGAFATEQWLADQGFAVIVADGSGSPGRGPAWEREIHLDLANGILRDQVAALEGCAEQFPDLDLDRVGIRGWSFGGYLAALAVLDRPNTFHAAVAGAPVTEWRLYDTAYTERYLGDPSENAAAYDASSLLPRAAQLTRPLLLIHGFADDNVLIAHTLQLSSALLAAGRAHDVLPLSGVTHMTPQEKVAENLLLTEVDFFKAALS